MRPGDPNLVQAKDEMGNELTGRHILALIEQRVTEEHVHYAHRSPLGQSSEEEVWKGMKWQFCASQEKNTSWRVT